MTTPGFTPFAEGAKTNDESYHAEQQAPLSSDSAIRASDDDGVVVLWINASEASKSCGQASGVNNYALSEHSLLPPPPLHRIDTIVWHRFTMKIEGTKDAVPGDKCTWLLAFIWSILFGVGDIWDAQTDDKDDDEQVPLWYCLIIVLAVVALFGRATYIENREETKAVKIRQRVLDRMQRTMAVQGYSLSLIQKKNCMCCTQSGIRIQPLTTFQKQEIDALAVETPEDTIDGLDERSAYSPQDWAPLEGMWSMVKRPRTSGRTCIEVPISTIKVSNTLREEDFSFTRFSRATLCYGLCARDDDTEGGLIGNALVLGDRGDNQEELLSLVPEEKRAQLRKVLEWGRLEATFYPLGLGRDGAYFYRNKTKGSIWKVHGTTWTMFHDLEDDFLTDAEILDGATLDHGAQHPADDDDDDDERNWVEFEQGSGVEGFRIADPSSTRRNYASAKLIKLRPFTSWVLATQFTAAVVLITFGSLNASDHTDLFAASLLIAAGVAAFVTSVCALLLVFQTNRAPFCVMLWSAIGATLHVALYVWVACQGRFVFLDTFPTFFTFPVCLASVWFCVQWWLALHEPCEATDQEYAPANL